MTSTTHQVGTAMMWSMMAKVGRFLLGLVSSVVVVRSLGDHDYGVLSVVRAVLMFVMIVSGAGMGQALLKYIPTLRVERGVEGARALIRTVVLVNLLIWAVLVVVTYFVRHPLESVFPFDNFGVFVAAAVALALFEVLYTLIAQIMQASLDTKLLSIASVAGHAVYIGLLLLVLPLGWGVMGVVVAGAGGNLAACSMLIGRVRAMIPSSDPTDSGYRIDGGRLAKFSIPFAIIGMLNFVVWRQSETIFLAHFRSASETGFFDLAYRVPQTMLEFIPGTIWPLVMVGISEVYSRNAGNIRLAIDRYYRMLFIICAPICLTGIVFAGKMVPIFFGEAMIPAAAPTQAFFAIFTLSFFGTPLSMALYVMEKTHVNLIVYVCLAVANVALDLVLIPRFGVPGAIIPVACVIFVSPFVYRAVLRRYVEDIGIPLRFIGKCFLASSPVLLLVPVLRFVNGVPELFAAVVVGVGLIVAAFKWLKVLGKEELDMLAAVPIPLARRFLRFMSS